MRKANLFDQILLISQDYLGPAAERFINRQVETHLSKDPFQLTKDDLIKLIDWIRLSFALLTDNKGVIDEYTHRLSLVANGKPDEALAKKWAQR